MNPIRRNILTTDAAATATGAAPRVFAQPRKQELPPRSTKKGNIRIRYREVGAGFPLIVAAPA